MSTGTERDLHTSSGLNSTLFSPVFRYSDIISVLCVCVCWLCLWRHVAVVVVAAGNVGEFKVFSLSSRVQVYSLLFVFKGNAGLALCTWLFLPGCMYLALVVPLAIGKLNKSQPMN